MDRTLDRTIQFDDASKQYSIRALTPQTPRSYTWACTEYLDQGTEGACVGFAWAHELAGRPKLHPQTAQQARALYRTAQTYDQWEGETYSGTSVLAGAKAVAHMGLMDEYRWAFGLTDLILAVGHVGPAVLGVPWLEGMADADDGGMLHATGGVLGGHAILCNGVNIPAQRFRVHNSWGKSWGKDGDAFISFADMDLLLHMQGEACIPVRRN